MNNFLSNNFSLEEKDFVKNRDSLYEFYFKEDYTRHDKFLLQAAACYADVVNYHLRMNYAFGSKEANDQVWFMAEWILNHKCWPIICGMIQKPFAAEIGTFVFNGLLTDDVSSSEKQKRAIETMLEYMKKFAPNVAAFLIRVLIRLFLIPDEFIPFEIRTFLDNN